MSAATVLAEAEAVGVSVRLENGKLLAKPRGTAPEELIARLRVHRDEIIGFLEAEEASPAVSALSLTEIQTELRKWQALGLSGVPRTEEEAERVAALWHRLDKLTGGWA